jgi:hypothetical protein
MKPVLVFPYHDPVGKYEKTFLKDFDIIKQNFAGICVSTTPATIKERHSFLEELEENGIFIYRNEERSVLGDHLRNAIKLAEKNFKDQEIFFGFIDRILFALETKYKSDFIKDVSRGYKEELIIFSRSDLAWASHPDEYRKLEGLVEEAGRIFFNLQLDWTWCGALMKKGAIHSILAKSQAKDMSILAEMILINLRKGSSLKDISVDWLEWEDPFWDNKNKNDALSQEEKMKRLEYCLNSMKMFL